MRELLLSNRRYFLILALAAVALRLYFVLRIPVVSGDALVYGDLAKNLLQSHVYGLTSSAGSQPTLIRLPGYPIFLAIIFKFFGIGNWRAVMLVHLLLDLATCFVVAAAARRMINARAAKIAFALAALCPFTANYVGTGLTESVSIFLTALAILLTVVGMEEHRLRPWIGVGLALAAAIQVRPDAGFLVGAIGLTILVRMWTIPAERKLLFKAGVVVLALALAPLVPWTIRNWRTFHLFQPLVTVHATDPGEWEATNWNLWTYSWLADYASMEDVIFKVDGEPVDVNDIPDRAYSDGQERQEVAGLIAAYNANDNTITPEMDAEFGKLAHRQMREHPVRYFIVMPVVRLADMWLRPRTEMLPLDTHFWRFDEDLHDSLWATGLMLLNMAFVYVAVRGILSGPTMRCIMVLLFYLAVRSFFLMTMGVVEDRYVLECFPCLFILGARYLAGKLSAHEEKVSFAAARTIEA